MKLEELRRKLEAFIQLENVLGSLWTDYVEAKRKNFDYDKWIERGVPSALRAVQDEMLDSLSVHRLDFHDVEGHDETAYYLGKFLELLSLVEE